MKAPDPPALVEAKLSASAAFELVMPTAGFKRGSQAKALKKLHIQVDEP